MKDRDSLIECMDAVENAMLRLQDSRDIWQNDIIYWLCRSVWLLLRSRIKEADKP